MHAIQETSICSAVHYRVADHFPGDKEAHRCCVTAHPIAPLRFIDCDLRAQTSWLPNPSGSLANVTL